MAQSNLTTDRDYAVSEDTGNSVHKLAALVLTLFTVYAAITVQWQWIQVVPMFLLLTVFYLFVRYPLVKTETYPDQAKIRYLLYGIDGVFAASAIVSYGYLILNAQEILVSAGTAKEHEIVLGFLAVLVVIEATRRTINLIVPAFALFFIVYAYVGTFFPGIFSHPGFSTRRIVIQLYLTRTGLWSFPLRVNLDFIYLFVVFGALLEFSGGGKAFLDLAKLMVGKMTGGPAKLAVVASGFMGMLNGSVVANTLTTGALTIPTMKDTGYDNDFAAGVESAASTGGQFMPPVMGAAIFIMVEITGIDYIFIIVHALLPALLYFFAIFAAVHFQSLKSNLTGLPDSMIPEKKSVLLRLYYFLPVIFLTYWLFIGRSVQQSVLYATGVLIIVTTFSRNARLFDPRREKETIASNPLVDGVEGAARRAAPIIVAATSIGIVLGIVGLTGTGLKISATILNLSEGSLFIALLLTMILCIIFGMAMDTITVYILLAVIIAPGLVNAGIETFSAHLFIFYFGMMAMVTPPVCLAAYAAATIADSDPIRSGFWAWKLALPAYLLPFAWVYNPAMLGIGDPSTIAFAAISAVISFTLLAAATTGYMITDLNIMERSLLIVAAVCLVHVSPITDAIGIAVAIVAGYRQIRLVAEDREALQPLTR